MILSYITIYVVCTNKSFITYLPVFLDLVIIFYIKHNIQNYFVLNPSLLVKNPLNKPGCVKHLSLCFALLTLDGLMAVET